MTIRVADPGAFTTVQDLGRPGWGSNGVPPCGAFDVWAFRAANALVGNPSKAAGLEVTMRGPTLAFDGECFVGVAGASADLELDGETISMGAFLVRSGQTLRVGPARRGVRAYVAFRGGIDVPRVLSSRATHVAAGMGGVEGRALIEGDILEVRPSTAAEGHPATPASVPGWRFESEIRVVPGPQADAFTDEARRTLLSHPYRVSPRSDRVGVRLDGPRLEHAGPSEIDPEGVVTGAIQVPGDGLPIVLGPDRPATGGYAKIATVIAADISLIAQARPGADLRFVSVSVEEARAAWAERESALGPAPTEER